MKYLIFDCSAQGKVKDWKAPFSDTFAWPRLLHISWIVLDKDFKLVEDFDFIVKQDEISSEAKKLCKIDNDDIKNKSLPVEEIIDAFNESAEQVEFVISFNLNFNENVFAAECIRQSKNSKIFQAEKFCLMQESTFYCKLPGKRGYKWPTLTQLHALLFKTAFTPPNNARADVIAATRSFIMLMKLGQLDDLFDEDELEMPPASEE